MTEQEMQLKTQSSIDVLLEKDAGLFHNDVAERTITARLAIYIQEQFANWNVDCEYNRNINDVKAALIKS